MSGNNFFTVPNWAGVSPRFLPFSFISAYQTTLLSLLIAVRTAIPGPREIGDAC
ncbi:hypothetical protein M434DRAFT_396168 [Hypoxylon sp. CO27-5]|nr:hypothetical protein M434DRAFT_396168 [Hypoxylon sp. CO27-5]